MALLKSQVVLSLMGCYTFDKSNNFWWGSWDIGPPPNHLKEIKVSKRSKKLNYLFSQRTRDGSKEGEHGHKLQHSQLPPGALVCSMSRLLPFHRKAHIIQLKPQGDIPVPVELQSVKSSHMRSVIGRSVAPVDCKALGLIRTMGNHL